MTSALTGSSTTGTYVAIEKNLTRYENLAANQPSAKLATSYYEKNIKNVTSIDQFVNNYRLLSYALQAYNLGDQVNSKALVKKVLEEGTSKSSALANTLRDPNWAAFAKAFNFSATGDAAPNSAASIATTTSNYTYSQMIAQQGQNDPGVQLALYFKKIAPTIKNSYGILADPNLLKVAQTLFNLGPTSNIAQIDKQATAIGKLMPLSDLQNPTKLNQLIGRFAAKYDAKYGPVSGATSSLTFTNGNSSSNTNVAAMILSDIVSANAQSLTSTSAYTPLISPSLLANLTLGG